MKSDNNGLAIAIIISVVWVSSVTVKCVDEFDGEIKRLLLVEERDNPHWIPQDQGTSPAPSRNPNQSNPYAGLANRTITEDNAEAILGDLHDLLINATVISEMDIVFITEILEKVSNISGIDTMVFYRFMNCLNMILNAENNNFAICAAKYDATERILAAVSKMAGRCRHDMNVYSGTNIGMLSVRTEAVDPLTNRPILRRPPEYYYDAIVGSTGGELATGIPSPENIRGFCLMENDTFMIFKNDSGAHGIRAGVYLNEGDMKDSSVSFMIMKDHKLFQTASERMKISPTEISTSQDRDGAACGTSIAPTGAVMSATRIRNGTKALIHDNVWFAFDKLHYQSKLTGLHSEFKMGWWKGWTWSADGCWPAVDPDGGVDETKYQKRKMVYYCDHLTDFALIVHSARSDPSICNPKLSILGFVLCGLSIVSLTVIISLIVVNSIRNRGKPGYPGKTHRVQQNLIGLPFLSTLLLFFTMFTLFANRTLLDIGHHACQFIAAGLYSLLLSVFLWTAYQGIVFYRRFVNVFGHTAFTEFISRPQIAYTVSFGVPLMFTVAVGFAVPDFFYRNDNFCWVRPDYVVLGVIVPISVLLFLDLMLTTMVVRRLCFGSVRAGTIHRRNSRIIQSTSARRAVLYRKMFAVALMEVVLGIPWILQYFTIGSMDVTPMHYLFTIFNASQGLFLGLLYLCCISLRTKLDRNSTARRLEQRHNRFSNDSQGTVISQLSRDSSAETKSIEDSEENVEKF